METRVWSWFLLENAVMTRLMSRNINLSQTTECTKTGLFKKKKKIGDKIVKCKTQEKKRSAHQHQTHGESARPPSEGQQLTLTFHDITCVTVHIMQIYVSNLYFNIFIHF